MGIHGNNCRGRFLDPDFSCVKCGERWLIHALWAYGGLAVVATVLGIGMTYLAASVGK
jgi:hypothetical protein